MSESQPSARPLVLGCGILRKEVELIIRRRGWDIEAAWLDSALHIHMRGLESALTHQLLRFHDRSVIVFYGECHPQMERMVGEAGCRTAGQNCAEMLLGPERFMDYLSDGAFFLLEEWARRFKSIMTRTFGPNEAVMREIFQLDHRYLLAIRTPCSSDFSAEAEAAGALVGLPVRWLDVDLDVLEGILEEAITRRRAKPPG